MPGQDVELVEHDAADAVDGHGVAQRHGVEPADPPRSPGDRAELMAAFRDPGADLVVELGRVRPGADPRRVGLHHADDLVDLERTDPATRAGAARDRVRRGDERVAPVVEVEQRPLGALEQDVLAARERRLDQPGRVVEVVAQPLAPPRRPRRPARRRSKVGRPIAARTMFLSTSARSIRSRRTARSSRSSIRRPSRHARSPYVGPMPRPVVPTLPSPSRASLPTSSATWYGMITCALRLTRTRDTSMPRCGEHVELVDERQRIDHDAVADDRRDVRIEHTRRRQPELEDLVAA